MEMEFFTKLPTPQELKEQFPVSEKVKQIKDARDKEIRAIFEGNSDKLLLIIGPCSADNEDAVLDYISPSEKSAGKGRRKDFDRTSYLCQMNRGQSVSVIKECCTSRIQRGNLIC